MRRSESFRSAAALSVALMYLTLSAAPTYATPLDKMGIAGVRIGMSEAEVVKAIQSFDANATVKRVMAEFPYFDGVNSLQTPAFLDHLAIKTSDSGLSVWFASAPSTPLVIAVFRRSGLAQPPGSEQLLSSLTAKYGPVTARNPVRPGGQTVAHWSEDDKPQCSIDKDGNGQLVPWNNAMGTLLIPNAVNVLEQYGRQRVPHLVAALGNAPDVARCGTVLRYEWTREPVQSFEAWLVDQGGMIAASRKSSQWVEELKADAVRKLRGQSATPKL